MPQFPKTEVRMKKPRINDIFFGKSLRLMSPMERLTALGIFEVKPRTRVTASAIVASRTPISSFYTPAHQRPIHFSKDIREITSPTLISTSSKILTVPLTEIWKDLKACGKKIDRSASRLNKE